MAVKMAPCFTYSLATLFYTGPLTQKLPKRTCNCLRFETWEESQPEVRVHQPVVNQTGVKA